MHLKAIALLFIIIGGAMLIAGLYSAYSPDLIESGTFKTAAIVIVFTAAVAAASFFPKLKWLKPWVIVVMVLGVGFTYCGKAMHWLDHNSPGQRQYRDRLRQHAIEEGLNPDKKPVPQNAPVKPVESYSKATPKPTPIVRKKSPLLTPQDSSHQSSTQGRSSVPADSPVPNPGPGRGLSPGMPSGTPGSSQMPSGGPGGSRTPSGSPGTRGRIPGGP